MIWHLAVPLFLTLEVVLSAVTPLHNDSNRLGGLWQPPQLDEWCAQVDSEPNPTWLVENLIPADAAVLVSGVPKRSYKTWFAFATAIAVASGRPVQQIRPVNKKGVPVLIIELEGPRKQTRNRFKFLEQGLGINIDGLPIYFSHREPITLGNKKRLKEICSFVERMGVEFVVIDTMAKICTGDENSSKDVGDAMRAIDAIRVASGNKASVMYLHHLRKPSKDWSVDIDDEIRGSSAFAGFYDVHFGLRRKDEERPLSLIVRHSDDEERYYSVYWDIDSEDQVAKLLMSEESADGYDPAKLNDYIGRLEPKKLYRRKALSELWHLGLGNTEKLIKRLREEGVLTEAGTKWRLVDSTEPVRVR